MYKSFRVKNFRCFKDLQINDLGRVNLIAGKNNTGKTALLEAISIYCGDRSTRTLLRSGNEFIASFHVSELGSSSAIDIDSIFYDFDMASTIEITVDIDCRDSDTWDGKPLFIRRVGENTEVYEREMRRFTADAFRSARFGPFDHYQPTEIIQFAYGDDPSTFVHVMVAKGQLQIGRHVPASFISSSLIRANSERREYAIGRQFSAIRQNKGISAIVDSLRVFEPQLEDLELLFDGHRPLIFADIGLAKLIPLIHLGDGINWLAGILLDLGELPDGISLIDEIENGIHYSLHVKVWKAIGKLARDLNIQVFATTHSREMIEAAHEAFKDDDPYEFRFHRLDRRSDTGDIRAVTYNDYGMKALAAFDFDHEVRG